MQKLTRSILAALVCASCSTAALAKDVTVMISGGFKAALEKLAPEYEAQSGDKIILVSGPSMGKTPQAIRAAGARRASRCADHGGRRTHPTGKERWTQPGSRVELADSPIGMVVKQGAPAGDKTDADLRNVLLQADSFAYSDSASGRYVSGQLFKSWASRNR